MIKKIVTLLLLTILFSLVNAWNVTFPVSSLPSYHLEASAAVAPDNTLILTHQNATASSGALFLSSAFSPRSSFSTYFVLTVTCGITECADGLAFVIQSFGPSFLGSAGGSMGFLQTAPGDYIGFAFKTFTFNYFAIYKTNDTADVPTLFGPVHFVKPNVSTVFSVWIDYDSLAHKLEFGYTQNLTTIKPLPINSLNISLETFFNNSSIYFGFTAGTGGATEENRVAAWTMENTCPMGEGFVNGTCSPCGPNAFSYVAPMPTFSLQNCFPCPGMPAGSGSNYHYNTTLCSICVATNAGNASFPSTNSGINGTTVTGSCLPGYTGTPPNFTCATSGTWRNLVGSCNPIQCPATYAGNASFPLTNSSPFGTNVTGFCLPGYSGTPPKFTCTTSGNWSNLLGSCSPIQCLPTNAGYAVFPLTTSGPNGTTITGSCLPGYSGTPPKFTCTTSGTWTNLIGSCTPTKCPTIYADNAFIPSVSSGPNGTTVSSSCLPGYAGVPPNFTCTIFGNWTRTSLTGSCIPIQCAATRAGNATFPLTSSGPSGTTIMGSCLSGYTGTPPNFTCTISGNWTNLVGSCSASNHSNTTLPIPSSSLGSFESSWVAFVIEGCVIFVILVVYLFCRRVDPTAKNTRVVTFGLSLVDILVDAFFLVSLAQDTNPKLSGPLFIAATFFFVAPIIFNFAWVIPLIVREFSNSSELEKWLQNHISIVSALLFLSGKNPQSLLLLNSRILKWAWLSASFSDEFVHKINRLGWIPNLFENIPQIIILILKAVIQGHWDSITLLALLGSLVLFVWAFLRQLLFLLLAFFGYTAKQKRLSRQQSTTEMTQFEHEIVPDSSPPPFPQVLNSSSTQLTEKNVY